MHLSGLATKWTRIHKPVALIKQITCMNNINPRIQEDMHVKQLMLEYGIDCVRGGSYSECQLSSLEMKSLRRELWYARNCCTRCGRDNHIKRNCNAHRDVNGLPIPKDVKEDNMNSKFAGGGVVSDDSLGASSNDGLIPLESFTEQYFSVSDCILEADHVEKRIKDCVRATKCLMLAVMAKPDEGDAEDKNTSPTPCPPSTDVRESRLEHPSPRDSPRRASPRRRSPKRSPRRSSKNQKLKGLVGNERSEISIARLQHASSVDSEPHKSLTTIKTLRNSLSKSSELSTTCIRCNRTGHTRAQCRESTDCFGFDLTDIIF